MKRRAFVGGLAATLTALLTGRKAQTEEPTLLGVDLANGTDSHAFVSMGGDAEVIGVWIDEADPLPSIPPHLMPAAGERWWFRPPRELNCRCVIGPQPHDTRGKAAEAELREPYAPQSVEWPDYRLT